METTLTDDAILAGTADLIEDMQVRNEKLKALVASSPTPSPRSFPTWAIVLASAGLGAAAMALAVSFI